MDENPRIAELRKKLEKDPGSRLFAQLAEELRKEGRHDEAINVALAGLEKIPNYPSARLTLARAFLDSGRPADARPELEQIVKASPDNILAGRLLGEALAELGEGALAIKQFERTLVFSPGDKAMVDRIAELKKQPATPPPAPAAPAASVAPAPSVAVENPSVDAGEPPSLFASEEPPSLFDAPAPSLFAAEEKPAPPKAAPPAPAPPAAVAPPPAAVKPLAAAPPVVAKPAAATPPVAPAPPAAASIALDRDLASGTFSPGSLNVADLQKHFEAAAAAENAAKVLGTASSAPIAAPLPEPGTSESAEYPALSVPEAAVDRTLAAVEMPEISETLGFGELAAADPGESFHSADTISLEPPQPESIGSETLGFVPPVDEPAELPGLDVADTVAFEPPAEPAPSLESAAVEPAVAVGSEEGEAELPALAMPSSSDVGAETLPLSSVTLADLYLQQGLKAEASAVLSQVMKAEPDNAEARSKFEAVAQDLSVQAEPVEHHEDAGAGPQLSVDTRETAAPRAARSRAEIRARTIASLSAFARAVDREAVQQRASELSIS